MRSEQQISEIKSRNIDPYFIHNFITQEEIQHLICLFEDSNELNSPYKINKNTGPVTLDLTLNRNDSVVDKILSNLEKEIGSFEITAGFYFITDYPHIIHNDDTYELPSSVFRGITIPLKLYGNFKQYPKLCFFDQYYYHGPSKFFNKETYMPTYFNKQIYDYKDVEGLTNQKFDKEIYEELFTHCRYDWFDGLSLHSSIDWIPGRAIIFDSVRLHCASDFRKLGIDKKLGISIFTKK